MRPKLTEKTCKKVLDKILHPCYYMTRRTDGALPRKTTKKVLDKARIPCYYVTRRTTTEEVKTL